MSAVSLPVTFKAIGAAALGAPFEFLSRTVSALRADQALVRVSYASINPMDASIHLYNWAQLPLPLMLGFDYSGVVVALGSTDPFPEEVEAVTVGAAVFGETFAMGSDGGCFGEYVVAQRKQLVLRGDLPEPEASTIGVAYLSAYEPLLVTTDISKRSGQTIFIPGGSGGVGHFAVQLAKLYGLRVITSASKPEGLKLLHKLGADVVLDYSKQDVEAEVLSATGGRGVDLAFDATYQDSSMKQSAGLVAKGGQWMRLGNFASPEGVAADVERIASSRGATVLIGDLGRYSSDPTYMTRFSLLTAGMRQARQLYADGKVRPHIAGTVPFDAKAVQQALDDMKKTVGKQVVKVQ